jgi:hypothetical protein
MGGDPVPQQRGGAGGLAQPDESSGETYSGLICPMLYAVR